MRISNPLRSLGEALRFLTILPQPWLPPSAEGSFAAALPFFPLAGLVIGGLLVATGAGANLLWLSPVPTALIVVLWVILTSGLHLDGLSDTFDGVMSWRPRERKLEIMRDSRIGAMGALALAAVVLLKVSFLLAAGAMWWPAVLIAPVLGRWAMIYGIVRFPSARADGLGQSARAQASPITLVVAAGSALLIAGLAAGLPGLLAVLAVTGVAHLLATWWTRALGGLTGDTYGALCELSEVVALAVISLRIFL
ncbi:adenosylcobinamide-GDP ribazoletransferase [Candidatus Oscillochloris fontis]|uniref:adenosylcobinamide-GDP ribazoletransferase n=1 Tax=Candidatus Oscillochloris fontis TaxID=2496868 RepID=UPI00101DB46B|nr:adenosylcobinamide-GDP ribazoletransferase [Candidatus Oscillochloris fontis]